MNQDLWKPKVGEIVKYVATSVRTGQPINIRKEVVIKVTPKFIYAGKMGHKFHRAPLGPQRGWESKSGRGFLSSRSHIEPVDKTELARLPSNIIEGSQYASALNKVAGVA